MAGNNLVKQNVTTSISSERVRKAKILAPRIVATARKAGAARILSEDLNPGQIIAGVQIENPFST